MKKTITSFLLLFVLTAVQAQSYWQKTTMQGKSLRENADNGALYSLDLNKMRATLADAKEKGQNAKPIEIAIPDTQGNIEKFLVYSLPVMDKALAEKYSLGSYAGVSVTDPLKSIRFSTSPTDFASMTMRLGNFEFIDVANKEKTVYSVHAKTYPTKDARMFLCTTKEGVISQEQIKELYAKYDSKSSDRKYRTMRLALSVTGEYTQYFGGTVAGALVGMNNTMTRVNGVLEKDMALHLNMINNTTIIYTDPNTDPYSVASTGAGGAWNSELQSTLTSVVGEANYDIGHLFGASGGGGNAGCIGCVCVDGSKGSGFTSPADAIPAGDNFDIDYVVHEMGHQLGANHTFSHTTEGTGVNVEPGSGSTIMGYAGITGATDVQPHSDPYFHGVSIIQIQNNLALSTKTCDVETSVANNPPVIAAMTNYTIPKSTAFVLTASATDAENDPITYCWEQVNSATTASTITNLGTLTNGPDFRTWNPTTSGVRYFPKLSTVLAGNLKSTTDWEAVSTVARATTFRVTVRDNNPDVTQQQTQSLTQTITVNAAGPFKVTSTKVYNNSSVNPITWDVVGTTASPFNVANVKIDYTTDNGTSWTDLSTSTPNDGTEVFDFSALATGTNIIVRVSAIGNVFYAVGNVLISHVLDCDGSAPLNVAVSSITSSGANVTWDAINNATYAIQYRPVGSTTWLQTTSTTNSVTLSGLTESTPYEVQVAAVCTGTTGTFTASTNFTTLSSVVYCSVTTTNSTEEYISNVTVNGMSNTSGATNYSDFTTDPTKLINLITGSTYTISVGKSWQGTIYSENVTAWIDYNRDGTFDNATEKVMSSAGSTTTPVTASFTVPLNAYAAGFPVRMRVALKYGSTLPTNACTGYTYGEIEDYNVKITSSLAASEATKQNVVSVYPNPASDEIKISNVSANASFKIFSVDGKLVKSGSLSGNATNVLALPKGVYIITITDKDKTQTLKFIKQ